MLYKSTRGKTPEMSASEAIKMGLAVDGGLFVPDTIPQLSRRELASYEIKNYSDKAAHIFSLYLTDFSKEEIADCVEKAYGGGHFDNDEVAPLVHLKNQLSIMELWHGPTCAFKDVALQILPQFMVQAMKKTREDREIVVLVATSGDTGKAALEGFSNVSGTQIVVFYPATGVSAVQEQQMVTQTGSNTHVVAVSGNFDDTQTGVKKIFSSLSIKAEMDRSNQVFSSANSINWGRLVPQIVYYFSAYADMCKEGKVNLGDPVNFVVPTGNFGNILAAWYAKNMGLPVHKLICASNDNHILTDFIESGIYDRRREFHKTISPSMDILISSNLERLLFEISGRNDEKVEEYMVQLGSQGYYEIDSNMKAILNDHFYGGWTNQEETIQTIRSYWENEKYLVDTHTAVALKVYRDYTEKTGDMTPSVVVSTASPFKFTDSVSKAVLGDDTEARDEFELLRILSLQTNCPIPKGLSGLKEKTVLHSTRCSIEEMPLVIAQMLKNIGTV